jgi:small subunit ribosomal protein S17
VINIELILKVINMTAPQRALITSYTGTVDSKSGDQTVRVKLEYQTKHAKYGKFLRRRTTANVHDQDNTAKVGDLVEIVKCKPMSKTKHWRLVRVIESN